MLAVFLKTLPFFGLIGLGYIAGRTRFFPQEATAHLTKFVFYFALSAMLFKFSATLSFADIFDPRLAAGYLWGTAFVYGIGMAVAFYRGLDTPTASIEAQCGAIGNTGFLGVPMLALLMGQAAVGPIILVLAIDLIVFSSLLTVLVVGSREERGPVQVLGTALKGLARNPMIVSIGLGLCVSASGLPLPVVADESWAPLGLLPRPARSLPSVLHWQENLPSGSRLPHGSAFASWCCTRCALRQAPWCSSARALSKVRW